MAEGDGSSVKEEKNLKVGGKGPKADGGTGKEGRKRKRNKKGKDKEEEGGNVGGFTVLGSTNIGQNQNVRSNKISGFIFQSKFVAILFKIFCDF